MTRILNTRKTSDSDYELDHTFNLAGKKAFYRGFGEWYGKSLAMVATNWETGVAVIAWQDGYPLGLKPEVEKEIHDYINHECA